METYEQAVTYLLSLIRPQQKADAPQRMARLLKRLGDPHRQYDILHIAGTSGKGSTATFSAALLEAGGWRCGLTVSPHLHAINERIRWNGANIANAAFLRLTSRIRVEVERLEQESVLLTYFDALLAIAFLYWAEQGTDIAVVETGIGGTHDGSNVVIPAVAVLTNVGLDHTELLGSTVELIASDKAGIIKPGCIAVSAVQQSSVQQIVLQRCREVEVPLRLYGRDYSVERLPDNRQDGGISQECFNWRMGAKQLPQLRLKVWGEHQIMNAATALAAIYSLDAAKYQFDDAVIRSVLAQVQIPGRLELISSEPVTANLFCSNVLLDGAHNPDKIRALTKTLGERYPGRELDILFAAKKGKDVAEMLALLLPFARTLTLTRWGIGDTVADRLATPPDQLAEIVRTIAPTYQVEVRIEADIRSALTAKQQQDNLPVLVTGSLYLVGEVRSLLLGQS